MKQNNIPAEFADYYYLRSIDLFPERLGDHHLHMGINQCREFYKRGLLFHTREDAMRSREAMMRGYIAEVVRLKGSVNIRFDRPLCP